MEVRTISPSSLVDDLIFGEDADWAYALPREQVQSVRLELSRLAFQHHHRGCKPYAQHADRMNFEGKFSTAQAIKNVPLVPTLSFKRHQVVSVPESTIVKWSLSSGTQGFQSRVGRDRTTMERLLGTVKSALLNVGNWYEHEVEVVNLGPSHNESGDIWFSYVMGLIELIYPTVSTVDLAEAESAVHQACGRAKCVFLTGAPFLVLELARRMSRNGSRLPDGNGLHVVTAGGWKKNVGASVSREALVEELVRGTGMLKPSRLRDVFNQVELNTVMIECSNGKKHIPPWLVAGTRSMRDLSPLPFGEPGLLSYFDMGAKSYPAMIVGDDIGVVSEGTCACGLIGEWMEIHGRVSVRGARGCALSIENQILQQGLS